MTNLSRRQFLRGRFKKNESALRPPWAILEEQFIEVCTRCDECISICPEKVIQKGQGGFPEIIFKHSGCEFCEDCLAVCQPKALYKQDENTQPWFIKAEIQSRCITYHGTICRTCGEACDDEAIRFKLEPGKVGEPVLNVDNCTGCGFCIAMCPVDAIAISTQTISKQSIPAQPI